ncbi:MAG: GNAT family N-acetyltransferase [Lachnospiraceae bacterium]|nr:GNAT family N-acetyltransferase [Lachnospiraceae bacterium]
MTFTFQEIQTKEDITLAYELYRSNTAYFQLVSGKSPTRQDVMDDRDACPPGVFPTQKKYGMYLLDGIPVAIVDVLEGFPDPEVYYIGLFLIDGKHHREGLGRALYEQMEAEARVQGFRRMRLGVVDTNHRARSFWQAMDFSWVKTVESTLHEGSRWTVEIMEKNLD